MPSPGPNARDELKLKYPSLEVESKEAFVAYHFENRPEVELDSDEFGFYSNGVISTGSSANCLMILIVPDRKPAVGVQAGHLVFAWKNLPDLITEARERFPLAESTAYVSGMDKSSYGGEYERYRRFVLRSLMSSGVPQEKIHCNWDDNYTGRVLIYSRSEERVRCFRICDQESL